MSSTDSSQNEMDISAVNVEMDIVPETSVPETPVTETPVTETPATETLVTETPAETQSEKTLKTLLEEYLKKSDRKIPLTVATKRMIVCLTNVPSDALEKVELLVDKVFEDGTLDIQDAPQLMILVQELFELYSAMKFNQLKPESCASVLKVVAHVVYIHKFSKRFSESESTVLLSSFNSVIDTSVMLIGLKETVPGLNKCKWLWCC